MIVQITNDIIGPWARISNGTLYPVLSKLEKAGLIQRSNGELIAGQTEPSARTFVITETGRARFHELMLDTSSNPGDYQRLFRLKVAYLDLVSSDEAIHLLNHYANYCQTCILHMSIQAQNLTQELAGRKGSQAFHREMILEVLKHHGKLWQIELDWAKQLLEQITSSNQKEKVVEN